jgi:hypothetical protein
MNSCIIMHPLYVDSERKRGWMHRKQQPRDLRSLSDTVLLLYRLSTVIEAAQLRLTACKCFIATRYTCSDGAGSCAWTYQISTHTLLLLLLIARACSPYSYEGYRFQQKKMSTCPAGFGPVYAANLKLVQQQVCTHHALQTMYSH